MKKNVASQVVGVQMVTASDGSAFTGTVSVAVTVDGGTQGAGGGTGPTHEGNGFHSYIPTQAETNGDHVAFTFTGTGAIPATVQVYTTFPQTGDSFARLGAPAGASVSADIATVDTVVDGIQTDLSNGTDGLGAIKTDTAAILADTGTDGVVIAPGQTVATVTTVTNDVGVNEWNGVALATTNPLPNAAAGAAGGLPTDSTGKTSFNDLSAAQVNAEVDTALADVNLDHLVGTATGIPAVPAGTYFDQMLDDGTAVYDRTTDSLQAIRDHVGDGTNLTEAGGTGDHLTAVASAANLATVDTVVDGIQADLDNGTDGLGAIKTETASIQADTNDIQTRLPAALTGAGNIKADALAVDGSTTAATHLKDHALTAVPVTFSATSATTTTATLVNVDGSAASSTDDYYNGRVLIFTGGTPALVYQATDITDYNGTTKVATFTAVTVAPDATTTAVMV